jgi:hypothetical protein
LACETETFAGSGFDASSTNASWPANLTARPFCSFTPTCDLHSTHAPSLSGTRGPTKRDNHQLRPADSNHLPLCRQLALTCEHAPSATVPCLHSLMRLNTRRAFHASAWGKKCSESGFFTLPHAKWLCLPVQSDPLSPHAMPSSYKSQLSFIAHVASRRHSHLILPLSFSAAASIFSRSRCQCNVGTSDLGDLDGHAIDKVTQSPHSLWVNYARDRSFLDAGVVGVCWYTKSSLRMGQRRCFSAATASNSGSSQPIASLVSPFFPRKTQYLPSRCRFAPARVRQFCDGTALACPLNTRHLGASTWGSHVAVRCFYW